LSGDYKEKFKAGDVVVYTEDQNWAKHRMTVQFLFDIRHPTNRQHMVQCVWFNRERKLMSAPFAAKFLRKVTKYE
jgi:hypothetical protein